MSYSNFAYKGLQAQCALHHCNISFSVSNTGSVSGAEVAQLYVTFPSNAVGEPAKQLRAFHKTAVLAPGASEAVAIQLPPRAFSIWDDVSTHAWKVVEGSFIIEVGGASDKLPLATNAAI